MNKAEITKLAAEQIREELVAEHAGLQLKFDGAIARWKNNVTTQAEAHIREVLASVQNLIVNTKSVRYAVVTDWRSAETGAKVLISDGQDYDCTYAFRLSICPSEDTRALWAAIRPIEREVAAAISKLNDSNHCKAAARVQMMAGDLSATAAGKAVLDALKLYREDLKKNPPCEKPSEV